MQKVPNSIEPVSIKTCEHNLAADLARLGISASDHQLQQLVHYMKLLRKWNETINLVSRQDIDRLWPRHVLDSLSVVPLLSDQGLSGEQRVLDIGSGGGLPGIPLAILLTHHSFTLCDRSARKTRFLSQVVRELGLANVQVVNADAEVAEQFNQHFDAVVARAVAPAQQLWPKVKRCLCAGGQLLVFASQAHAPETDIDAQVEIHDIDGLPNSLPHRVLRLRRVAAS